MCDGSYSRAATDRSGSRTAAAAASALAATRAAPATAATTTAAATRAAPATTVTSATAAATAANMAPTALVLFMFSTIFATLVVIVRAGEPRNPCIVFPIGSSQDKKDPPTNYSEKFEFFDKVVLDHLAEINVKHMCAEVSQTQVYEQLKICYSGKLRWCKEWFQDWSDSGLAPLSPLDSVCFSDLRYTDTQYCRPATQHSI